jgi:hypothetical protein
MTRSIDYRRETETSAIPRTRFTRLRGRKIDRGPQSRQSFSAGRDFGGATSILIFRQPSDISRMSWRKIKGEK